MNIADKYAIAFINVYGTKLTFDDILKIEQASLFLQHHNRALFLLRVPMIKRHVKEARLQDFCDRLGLVAPIGHIIRVLLEHQRIQLLEHVFTALVYHYKKRYTIKDITVKSSIELPNEYRQQITRCIDQKIPGTKIYHYTVDPTLIAGIRIQSDTFVWEFSIDKRLREISYSQN